MNRLSAACLVLLLVLAGTAPAVAHTPDSPGGTTDAVAAAQEFDRTEFTVAVHDNGSARWTFSYKWNLETEEDRQQFDQYKAAFNENETDLYTQFQNQSKALAASGEAATGRSMNASGFTKQAEVNDLGNQGIVEMQFTWSNFAQSDGGQLIVGDVFEGGLYIGPNQTLTIKHDGPLQFIEAEPEPDAISGEKLSTSDSVTWLGEQQFADQQPRVVLGQPGSGASTTAAADPSESGGLPLVPIAAVLVLLAMAAGAFAYRSGAFPMLTRGDDDSAGGAAAATTESSEKRVTTTAVTDEELLTDEDRVMRLLEESGGRMRQVNIVDETGWSKSKVSMLLSDMEDDGTISKLRMGRENIVSLSGHEPEATQSSLDDK